MSIFSLKKIMSDCAVPALTAVLLMSSSAFAADMATQNTNSDMPATDATSFPPAPTEEDAGQAQQPIDTQSTAPQTANSYKGVCNSQLVRAMAKERFTRQMADVPNQNRMSIVSFSNVSERQYKKGTESYNIDRHYCTASVTMTNGQSYPATYVVERNQGFAGIGGRHVSFCVNGLDKWLIRDNDCRALRAPVDSLY